MTEQEQLNAKITRRWFTEGWTTNPGLAPHVFSPAFVTNGAHAGIEGPKRTVESRIAAFPDLSTIIEQLIVSGDTIVVRVLWSGTHTGAYAGVAATGKRVSVRVISMWRFEEGRVVENWTLQDQFTLLQQVGYLPTDLTTAQGAWAAKAAPD
jgi:predicted ester cyclase